MKPDDISSREAAVSMGLSEVELPKMREGDRSPASIKEEESEGSSASYTVTPRERWDIGFVTESGLECGSMRFPSFLETVLH